MEVVINVVKKCFLYVYPYFKSCTSVIRPKNEVIMEVV